ncbi:MAG TPA: amidohydrolase family protein, partial [Pyrinomonadaceae bacterium]|nr:amidohydrolase family protein [Pyrinomonadaceae bacterium]
IGTLETGKRADLIAVNLNTLHAAPHANDPVSALVYSAQTSDVQTVVIDGQLLMSDRKLLTLNEESVLEETNRETSELMKRAGIGG